MSLFHCPSSQVGFMTDQSASLVASFGDRVGSLSVTGAPQNGQDQTPQLYVPLYMESEKSKLGVIKSDVTGLRLSAAAPGDTTEAPKEADTASPPYSVFTLHEVGI